MLKTVRTALILVLVAILSTPASGLAQSRVVQPSELQSAIERASAARRQNLAQVRGFFSSKPVRAALSKTTMSPERIDRAVSSLSADELAKLSARTQKIQADFAAGALSNQELTYIVIALGAALIVLVVVAA
jgi:hypothetical protein